MQVSEYVEKFVKLCPKSFANALYIRKNAADKIANADQANNFQLLEYLSSKKVLSFELASLDIPEFRM